MGVVNFSKLEHFGLCHSESGGKGLAHAGYNNSDERGEGGGIEEEGSSEQ